MKTENIIMLSNLIIFKKLLKIFAPIIPISWNLKQKLGQYKITKLKRYKIICLRDFASKQGDIVMMHSLFSDYHIYRLMICSFC